MPQIHYQQRHGIFHVTTNTQDSVPWCTKEGIPHLLIEHLCKTRDTNKALLHAFCILPTHIHLIVCPGAKGISKFLQSLKSNSVKDLRKRDSFHNIGWQSGFHDERIRDKAQLSAAISYVQGNGMKHGLAKEVTDYPWTSLHFASVLDPFEPW